MDEQDRFSKVGRWNVPGRNPQPEPPPDDVTRVRPAPPPADDVTRVRPAPPPEEVTRIAEPVQSVAPAIPPKPLRKAPWLFLITLAIVIAIILYALFRP